MYIIVNFYFGMEASSQQFTLIIYFLAINLIAFFTYGVDKLKSVNGSRRVNEKTLWFLALVGGSVGSLFSMHVFRHKTKKLSFQVVLLIIILAQMEQGWLVQ